MLNNNRLHQSTPIPNNNNRPRHKTRNSPLPLLGSRSHSRNTPNLRPTPPYMTKTSPHLNHIPNSPINQHPYPPNPLHPIHCNRQLRRSKPNTITQNPRVLLNHTHRLNNNNTSIQPNNYNLLLNYLHYPNNYYIPDP